MTTTDRSAAPYSITIPRARFTAFLSLLVVMLLANHIMLQLFHYRWDAGHWVLRDMFDVDEEENLPTFYSSFALLLSGGLLFAIGLQKSAQGDRFSRHWLGLSCAFLALSIDEVAGVHEAVNTVIDIPWTIPAAVIVAIVGLLYAPFLWHLPPATRTGAILAGTLFVGGAVGVEHATDWYLASGTMDSLEYNLLTAAEEGLEMFGVIVFIHTLLGYMSSHGDGRIDVAAEERCNPTRKRGTQ